MISTRIIRKVLSDWINWRARRRLYRAMPEMILFDQAERAAKRRHDSVEHIRAARKEYVTAALRQGAQP